MDLLLDLMRSPSAFETAISLISIVFTNFMYFALAVRALHITCSVMVIVHTTQMENMVVAALWILSSRPSASREGVNDAGGDGGSCASSAVAALAAPEERVMLTEDPAPEAADELSGHQTTSDADGDHTVIAETQEAVTLPPPEDPGWTMRELSGDDAASDATENRVVMPPCLEDIQRALGRTIYYIVQSSFRDGTSRYYRAGTIFRLARFCDTGSGRRRILHEVDWEKGTITCGEADVETPLEHPDLVVYRPGARVLCFRHAAEVQALTSYQSIEDARDKHTRQVLPTLRELTRALGRGRYYVAQHKLQFGEFRAEPGDIFKEVESQEGGIAESTRNESKRAD